MVRDGRACSGVFVEEQERELVPGLALELGPVELQGEQSPAAQCYGLVMAVEDIPALESWLPEEPAEG